jgi:serine/threonine-protein kinase HipA
MAEARGFTPPFGNRERSAFEYHGDWLADSKSFPIEPSLRLVSGPQFYKASKDGSKFSGAIADTEPDGWGRRVILRDHAKRREHAVGGMSGVRKSI